MKACSSCRVAVVDGDGHHTVTSRVPVYGRIGAPSNHVTGSIRAPDEHTCASCYGDAPGHTEANQPPPAKVTETPEVEGTPEPRPAPDVEPESDDRGADPFGPDYGCDLRSLLGKPDLPRVEEAMTALLVDALLPAPPLSVRARLDGETMHVTITIPGRLASLNTTAQIAPKRKP